MEGPSVERELALGKVAGAGEKRVESRRIADIFRARVVDSSHAHFVFEMTGKSEKLDVFIDLMQPLGLVDGARNGAVATSRGTQGLYADRGSGMLPEGRGGVACGAARRSLQRLHHFSVL